MENRVKLLRMERNLNQVQLGDLVGLSQQSVSRIEKDSTKITADTLVRLSSYFGVTTDYLLGLTDRRWSSELLAAREKEMEQFREFYHIYKDLNERDQRLLCSMGQLMKEKKQTELVKNKNDEKDDFGSGRESAPFFVIGKDIKENETDKKRENREIYSLFDKCIMDAFQGRLPE